MSVAPGWGWPKANSCVRLSSVSALGVRRRLRFGEMGGGAGGYYLASAFEQIWLQPSGDVGLTGIALNGVFFRSLLDKLSVTPEFSQRKEFKGAMGAMTDTGFTGPVRANLEAVARSLFDRVIADVVRDRRLDPIALRQTIDSGPHEATDARAQGLGPAGILGEARAEAR